MASPHSHHHCHHQHHHSTCCCTSPTCICCSSYPQPHFSQPYCQSHHQEYYPQISTTTTDPLYQALYSKFLQQSSSSSHQPQPHHHKQQQFHHHNEQDKKQTQSLLTSLLRRIDALESSLPHFASPPPPPSSSPSLRDIAARTIQTYFRAYLVRRSRTLRHLKHLALIKTSLNSLKSSVSDKPHFNYQALSQKAMNLLLKLDSIQGGDPTIRDGKRTISRDLVHFLEFIDGVSVKRHQIYSTSMKKVKFAEDNEDSSLYMGAKEDCKDDQRELIEELCKKVENIEGFARKYEENEEEAEIEAEIEAEGSSSKLSNGERNPRNNVKSKGSFGSGSQFQGQNGNSLFSAPLPVQMEEPTREDLLKREKIVRVSR